MKIKAIFFDQDNTLFNSSEIAPFTYTAAIDYVADELDVDAKELFKSWQDIVVTILGSKDRVKRHFRYSLTETIKSYNPSEDLLNNAMKIYYGKVEELIQPKEGVLDFFAEENDLINILFTEDSRISCDLKLKKFKLVEKFNLTLTSDDIGLMKPDIKYLEVGWQKFNLKPEECIYVGDNWEKDCQIGQEKGGIGVVFEKEDERANYQIKDMMELLSIIKSL